MTITQQVQKEDEALRHKLSCPASFELKHLWIPQAQEFSNASLYALFHSL